MARLLIITEYEERHIYDVISGIKDYVLEKNVPDPTICTISKEYVASIGMKGLVESRLRARILLKKRRY